MNPTGRPIMSPDAALFLAAPYFEGDPPGPKLYFFKNRQFVCWDVMEEKLCEGYPRDIEQGFPGLLAAGQGAALRAALHVPHWGQRVFFFFEGQAALAAWDLEQRRLLPEPMAAGDLLPGVFSSGPYTPVYAELSNGEGVIYAFQGLDYQRWRVGSAWPAQLDSGFPHKTAADWKDGLVLAPRSGVYLEWPNRSAAHSNRKIYFFMGDLYLRWDVPSNTRNYRLDIVAGWKGWPNFA